MTAPKFSIDGLPISIEIGDESLAPSLSQYLEKNRNRFAPIMPKMSDYYLTEDACRNRIRMAQLEFQAETSLKLLILDNKCVIGNIHFTNIVRGPLQACFLGYKLDIDYEGRGVMYAALSVSIDYVFSQLNIHRISANYIPTNERSGKLLKRLGFKIEGFARDYLYLNGRWQDHILTSKINNNWTLKA